MVVYREDEEAANPAELMADFVERADAVSNGQVEHDEIVSLLIDLGMLEADVVDALFPEVDGTCATTLALRRASLFAGLLRHSWRGVSGSWLVAKHRRYKRN